MIQKSNKLVGGEYKIPSSHRGFENRWISKPEVWSHEKKLSWENSGVTCGFKIWILWGKLFRAWCFARKRHDLPLKCTNWLQWRHALPILGIFNKATKPLAPAKHDPLQVLGTAIVSWASSGQQKFPSRKFLGILFEIPSRLLKFLQGGEEAMCCTAVFLEKISRLRGDGGGMVGKNWLNFCQMQVCRHLFL